MLDRIAALFSRPQAARQARAERLYAAAAAQSRAPVPFREHGVPDTLDGRFDSLCLHIFLVIRRAGREGGEGATLAGAGFLTGWGLLRLLGIRRRKPLSPVRKMQA